MECADKTSSLVVRNEEKKGIKSYKDERHPLPWEVFLKLSSLYYDSSYIHKPLYISLCLPLLEGISWFGTLKPSFDPFALKSLLYPSYPGLFSVRRSGRCCFARWFWLGLANDDRMAGRLKCISEREIRIFLLLSHHGNISPTMSPLRGSSFHGLLPPPGSPASTLPLWFSSLVMTPVVDNTWVAWQSPVGFTSFTSLVWSISYIKFLPFKNHSLISVSWIQRRLLVRKGTE